MRFWYGKHISDRSALVNSVVINVILAVVAWRNGKKVCYAINWDVKTNSDNLETILISSEMKKYVAKVAHLRES